MHIWKGALNFATQMLSTSFNFSKLLNFWKFLNKMDENDSQILYSKCETFTNYRNATSQQKIHMYKKELTS